MTKNSGCSYIIDLDGTIYRGLVPIPHAGDFLHYLENSGRNFLLATNCPRNTPDSLTEKLSGMGIQIRRERVLTSGQVTASYIADNYPGAVVYLIGSTHLQSEMSAYGVKTSREYGDIVVVGYDTDFCYEKMKKAVQLIMKGASFICTNCDATIPEGDAVVPHTGAIAAGIEAATGVSPLNMGKPERYFMDEAIRRMGCRKEECCIIGDRLDTDILAGTRNGVKACLVLTGVTGRRQAEESDVKPDLVFNDLRELKEYDMQCCV